MTTRMNPIMKATMAAAWLDAIALAALSCHLQRPHDPCHVEIAMYNNVSQSAARIRSKC